MKQKEYEETARQVAERMRVTLLDITKNTLVVQGSSEQIKKWKIIWNIVRNKGTVHRPHLKK